MHVHGDVTDRASLLRRRPPEWQPLHEHDAVTRDVTCAHLEELHPTRTSGVVDQMAQRKHDVERPSEVEGPEVREHRRRALDVIEHRLRVVDRHHVVPGARQRVRDAARPTAEIQH